MSNNIVVRDGIGALITVESNENVPGIQTWVHDVRSLPTDPLGTTTDAATVGDVPGSISAKLRGLVKWAFTRMPAALGQTTKSGSLPITLASDDDLLTKIGEVQATPTANTVLDRLKQIQSGISFSAGESFLGKFGRPTVVVSVTPTITASSYVIGDCVGGIIAFPNSARVTAGSGQVLSILLNDIAAQKASFDLLLFDSNPNFSTFTDHAGAVLHTSDIGKLIGSVDLSQYVTIKMESSPASSPRSFCRVKGDLVFALPSGQTLYGVLILKGVNPVPTYLSTSDLSLRVWVEQN